MSAKNSINRRRSKKLCSTLAENSCGRCQQKIVSVVVDEKESPSMLAENSFVRSRQKITLVDVYLKIALVDVDLKIASVDVNSKIASSTST